MSQTIKITRTNSSSLSSVNLDNLPFGKVFTDHMFSADFIDGVWQNFEIKPLENLSVHPGNLAWHYGQSIFEGMKASINEEGTPLLFRPEMHIVRLNASAERMCMPKFPEEVFLDAIRKLVALENAWIPNSEGSALYLRPMMYAADEAIGVRPSDRYKMLIMALPVGPYYSKPVSLYAETEYVRAAVGGVGEAKTAGNYAASLYPAQLAKEKGYDQILWLDAKEFKYVQEVGTMNLFFVIDGKVLTPIPNGAILKGITRDSIIDILRDKGYDVEQRDITIDEVFEAHKNGKLDAVFGSGTAAVVINVNKIAYKDQEIELDITKCNVPMQAKQILTSMRNGTSEDKFGWVEKVELLETVA